MNGPLAGFVRKEVLHLLRDTRTLAILVLLPIVTILLFGFAIRTDVRNVRLVIVDPTPDAATARLRAAFAASDRFRLLRSGPDERQVEAGLRSGAVQLVVVLPPEVARTLGRGDSLSIQISSDASDPNSSAVRTAFAAAIIRAWHADAAVGGQAGQARLEVTTRNRYNPTLESAYLLVPGLVAFVLTIVSALMTAISITREKEIGTMEMLLVSPLRPAQIVAGKVMPYIVIGFFDVVLLLVAARQVFGVPMRGSIVLLLGVSLLYILTSLGLGIVISTRVVTQRAAMLAALAGLMLPTLMLSGFIFPISSLPAPLRVLTFVVPARWFLTMVRGIMLKGAGLEVLWPDLAMLSLLTIALFVVGARRLSIRLD